MYLVTLKQLRGVHEATFLLDWGVCKGNRDSFTQGAIHSRCDVFFFAHSEVKSTKWEDLHWSETASREIRR